MYLCIKLRFDCKYVYVNKGKNNICNFFFFNSTLRPVTYLVIGNGRYHNARYWSQLSVMGIARY
jgi:hypothetical protein